MTTISGNASATYLTPVQPTLTPVQPTLTPVQPTANPSAAYC